MTTSSNFLLTSREQSIVERIQHHQFHQPGKWESPAWEYQLWYKLAYKHMLEQTWPKIQSNNETMVDYWLTQFLWGETLASKNVFVKDGHYLSKTGSFGAGYTCLTLSNLYIVSLKQITEWFPLYKPEKKGFLSNILGHKSDKLDERKPLAEDYVQTIPVQSLLNVQIVPDRDEVNVIALFALDEQLIIHRHENSDRWELETIATAIRMAYTGKLTQVLGLNTKSQDQTQGFVNQEDPIEKLKQIKQMYDAKLITVEEYERKKADILSRI